MTMLLPPSTVLPEVLRSVPRRYRLPEMAKLAQVANPHDPATVIALLVENARQEQAAGKQPSQAWQQQFLQALAHMIEEAMQDSGSDPAFQAQVLRHHNVVVQQYAALADQADADKRWLYSRLNALAHPEKLRRQFSARERALLEPLHQHANATHWETFGSKLSELLHDPQFRDQPEVLEALEQMLHSTALQHLRQLAQLANHPHVQQFEALWQQAGPRAGSPEASVDAANGQQRGAAVESSTAAALSVLVQLLNQREGHLARHRLVTSMRVPASLPASHDRAKTEWDAVVLRQAATASPTQGWEVCLLVEAKAAIDATTNDLPRLIRGLRLLAHAEPDSTYTFKTREGNVRLLGASLATLSDTAEGLLHTVLYCCDNDADGAPRLLNAASRMQLLSAPDSLEFALALQQGKKVSANVLLPVWQELLTAPQYVSLREQTLRLRQVRELMVHVDDLRGTAQAWLNKKISSDPSELPR